MPPDSGVKMASWCLGQCEKTIRGGAEMHLKVVGGKSTVG